MTEKLKFVEYRGVRMIEEWPAKIEAAQKQPTYELEGRPYERLRHNEEEPCHDCAVFKGELHVPSCDAERCPICGGQYISCGCFNEDEEDDELEIP